jgi:hypothetical protein
MWSNVPAIVTSAALTVAIEGEGGRSYGLRVNDLEASPFPATGDGRATAPVTLVEGINQLCAIVSTTADFSLLEARNCVEVVYVP